VHHEVDVGVRGQRRPGPRVAEQQLQRAVGDVHQRCRPPGGERRLLRRLEHDGVAGHQGGRDLAEADGEREVPRDEQRDDAARLVDHHVRRVPAALQAAAAMQRTQLGHLLDVADARRDRVERGGERFAAFAHLELCQLTLVLAQPGRARLEQATALGRIPAAPRPLRRPRRAHGGVGRFGRARREWCRSRLPWRDRGRRWCPCR
jgi:hypothetical protein